MSRATDMLWSALVTRVMDSRGDWRRRVTQATGLPFGRVRALRRLAEGPLALRELAEAMSTDAPAATVAINDLERRGLVARTIDSANRRRKRVSLTPAGRQVVARLRRLTERAPAVFSELSSRELAFLTGLVERLGGGSAMGATSSPVSGSPARSSPHLHVA